MNDVVMIIGLFLLLLSGFHNYYLIKKENKAMERVVREIALSEGIDWEAL